MITKKFLPVQLPVFEGPLDLLLFLIRRHEIDIYDIPLEILTRQYLDMLFEMEKLQLDVAGEFFVMASTLMEIKSRTLLPKNVQAAEAEDDEEEFDPRWELVHQLLEYQKFKQAAREVEELALIQTDLYPREVKGEEPLTAAERPLKKTDKLDLWQAFNNVLRRLSEKLIIGEIRDESVTVSDQMEFILEILEEEKTFSFSELFEDRETTSVQMLVATFLGILELVRLDQIKVWQNESFSEIYFTGSKEKELEMDAE